MKCPKCEQSLDYNGKYGRDTWKCGKCEVEISGSEAIAKEIREGFNLLARITYTQRFKVVPMEWIDNIDTEFKKRGIAL